MLGFLYLTAVRFAHACDRRALIGGIQIAHVQFASLTISATEAFWSRAIRSAILRWGVVAIVVASSAVAPAIGMIMTVGAPPETGERLQGATSTPRFATSLGTEGAAPADPPALDLRGGVSD